jgi:hypothetical protein
VGVWESVIAGEAPDNPILRALYLGMVDTIADPLTYLGGVSKVGEATKAATLGTKFEAIGQAVGDLAKVPNAALELPIKAVTSAASATGKGIARLPVIGGIAERLAKETPESTYTRTAQETAGALDEQLAHATPPTSAVAAPLPAPSVQAMQADLKYYAPDPARRGTGKRIVDVAESMRATHPETHAAFFNEYGPLAQARLAADDALRAAKPRDWRVRQALNEADFVANDVVPTWQTTFGADSIAMPHYLRSGQPNVGNTASLIEHAVLGEATAAPARSALERQAPQVLPEVDRLRADFVRNVSSVAPAQPLGFVPVVSDEARQILDRPLASGQTVGQSHADWTAAARDAQAEARLLEQQIIAGSKVTRDELMRLDADTLWRRLPAALKNDGAQFVALRDEWSGFGNLLTDRPMSLATRRTVTTAATDASGYVPRKPSVLNLLVIGTARDSLHGPLNLSYSMRNALSDEQAWQLAFPGSRPLTSVQGLKAAVSRDYSQLPSWQRAEALGLGRPPREIAEATDKLGNAVGPSATRQLFDRVRLGGIGNQVAKPIEKKASIDAGLEQTRRLAAWSYRADARSAEALPKLRQAIVDAIQARGLPITPEQVDAALASLPLTFSPNQVFDTLTTLGNVTGIAPRAAENLARDGYRSWTNLARQVRQQAIADVSKPLPIARLRNIEAPLSSLVAFHQWQSRMLPYLVEEGIRNPVVAASWMRARHGLDKVCESGQYPAATCGWLRAMASPLGFAVFISPNTFAIASQLLDAGGGADTGIDQLTLLGKIKRELRRYGVGTWPVIDAAINATGAFGSDFSPSPFIFKEFRLAAAFTDLAMSLAGEGPHRKLWEELMNWTRQQVSGTLEGTVPGIRQVDATDPNAVLDDMINSMIADQHPEYSQERIDEAMNDTESPEYKDAFRRVAAQGALSAVWNTTMPLSTKTRLESRDATMATAKAGYAALDAGKEPTPEQQAAMNLRSAETAGGAQDRSLSLEQNHYQSIGTERQQNLSKGWANIAYANDLGSGYYLIDGKVIQTSDLMRMSDADRKTLANRWVANHEGDDELKAYRAERKAFIDQHPEYADLNSYKDAVFAYRGGPTKFRKDLAQSNPNFARAVADQEARFKDKPAAVRQRELDQWTTSLAGYEAASAIKASGYDPAPLDVPAGGQWEDIAARDTTLSGSTTATSGGTSSSRRVDTLTKHLAELEIKAQAFQQATGYPIDQMHNPIMEAQFRAQGLWFDVPEDVRLYREWVSLQPPGTDVSPAAFYAVVDALKPAA